MSEAISPGLENVNIKYTELTYIDGINGIMRYRGYDVNELAARSSFEEVSYLMLFGKLPNYDQLNEFKNHVLSNMVLPDYVLSTMKSLPKKSDALAIMQTAFSALSSNENNYQWNKENDKKTSMAILGQALSIVANTYRIKEGLDTVTPEAHGSYAESFLNACFGESDKEKVRAMDAALILYMDHEIPASTTAALVTASTLSDMYSSITSAITALRGPLHGGAAESAFKQFLEIKTPDNVDSWFQKNIIEPRKRLVGFGHRVYRTFDPRLKTFKEYARSLARTQEQKNLLEIATKLENLGVKNFGGKGIYTNTDFYSGLVFNELGFPLYMFTSLFGLSRISGILAHIIEYVETQERLIRPRAIYNGPGSMEYIEIEKR